jgi:aspartyl aminopeptidase
MDNEQLKKRMNELTWKFPHAYSKADSGEQQSITDFSEDYKTFLNQTKTEREFVRYAVELCEKNGYKPFSAGSQMKPGDRMYFINRDKALILTTIGKRSLCDGLRMTVSHIDSPRLDLKPFPLFEKNDIAYLKTHYYGGIRKYQWVTVPLALHGIVAKKDGSTVEIRIGEEPADPLLYITDLLPHLGAEQNEKKLKDGIKGEELNAIAATTPFDPESEEKNLIKLKFLDLINQKYNITEKDFLTAELTLVPAYPARDVGLDRALVGAYGQDDRVCAYATLRAELETNVPEHTTVTVFADKEEIGSYGNTGMNSDFTLHFIEDLCRSCGADINTALRNTYALSTDVGAAYDPNYPSVFDEQNSCHINKGCVLTKYTGARGKSGSNDASAETLAKVTGIFDEADILWQVGEIGAVDAGGGGTVALFVAHADINVVDLGVPILSMHSPYELASKADLYNLFKAVKAFYK